GHRTGIARCSPPRAGRFRARHRPSPAGSRAHPAGSSRRAAPRGAARRRVRAPRDAFGSRRENADLPPSLRVPRGSSAEPDTQFCTVPLFGHACESRRIACSAAPALRRGLDRARAGLLGSAGLSRVPAGSRRRDPDMSRRQPPTPQRSGRRAEPPSPSPLAAGPKEPQARKDAIPLLLTWFLIPLVVVLLLAKLDLGGWITRLFD